jgi:hypothetical protein
MEPRQNAMPPPAITVLTQDEVRRLCAVITGVIFRSRLQSHQK